jgi:hypothetical protein
MLPIRNTSHWQRHRLKVKGWKKIFQVIRDQKQGRVAILISDQVDFKPKLVRRDKEGYFT